MRLVLELFRHSGWLLLLAILTGLIGGLSNAGLVALAAQALTASTSELIWLAAGFFGLCAATFLARSGSQIMLHSMTQDLVLQLRISLCRRIIETPLNKLQQIGKPELLAILTSDIDRFVNSASLLPIGFINLIIIGACFGYLAIHSFILFAIFCLFFALGIACFRMLEQKPIAQLTVVRTQTDALYRHFRSLIEGSKELQLNARRAAWFIDELLAPAAVMFRDSLLAAQNAYTWTINVGNILFYLVLGFTIFLLPLASPLPPEVRLTGTLLVLYLIEPIAALLGTLPGLRQADISLKRIRQFGDTLDQLRESRPVASDPFAGTRPLRIEATGICHRLPGPAASSAFRIGPIDLSISQGDILFVTGGNGSGKTTLAMLLLGLYQPEAGSIELNGVKVTKDNIGHYRARFSAVFADFHLFETLLEVDEESFTQRGQRYLEALAMAAKVSIHQGRFSTTDLSSGERRRLALVSAYLEDRDVYFFDEWGADQDPTFRHIFYTELLPALKQRGKTTIVVSHDERYFGVADQLLRLEGGRLLPPLPGYATLVR